jgi:nicotinate-nucleotide adenylyltransferase
MQIGVFGGTFDPPHIAHLILAAEAYAQLNLAKVLWVLTPQPPHKRDQYITPVADRLAMLEAALGDDPAFELSHVDLDRPAPHYAVDTVRLLKRLNPEDRLIYLMGGDSLEDLPEWHDAQGFVKACDGLGVMMRSKSEIDLKALEASLPGIRQKVQSIRAPVLEISSTHVREWIAQGRPYRYYLPASVFQVIQERNIYFDILKI